MISPRLLALATAALLATATISLAADTRVPVPDSKSRAPAMSALKREFKTQLRSKDAAVKAELARTLLGRVADTGDDHATRYVLLSQASKLAAEARELRLILTASKRLAQHFDVSAAGPALKSVTGSIRGGKDAGTLAGAASVCIDIAGLALTENDHGTAKKALGAAAGLAKKVKLGGLQARVVALGDLVKLFQRLSKGVDAARLKLAEDPDDQASQRVLARFSCFGVGNWQAGLGQLAALDGDLKAIAVAEATPPVDAAARLDRADAWWALTADGVKRDPLVVARMRARAVRYYEEVLADEKTAGLPAERTAAARERLAQVTYRAWDGGVALTTDFSKSGPYSLGLASIQAFIQKSKIDTKSSSWRTKLPPPPDDIAYSPDVEYLWTLVTNKGEIRARFFPDTAPKHVTHFIYLTELGFFDGSTFHRVITRFMAQGGSPNDQANGNPGYFIHGETDSDRKHDKPGTLSTANTGEPKTDGSQFFITFVPTPNLDGKHTIFGEVISGMDAVKAIEKEGSTSGKTKSRLVIESATVSTK